jgi:hypothetical protein
VATLLAEAHLDDDLAMLAAAGWLVVKNDDIQTDDVQLMPAADEFWHDGKPTSSYRALVERVLIEGLPPSIRTKILRDARGAFQASDPEFTCQILRTFVATLPSDDRALGWAALELIACDAVAGDAGLRRYLGAHPDDLDRWHDWVDAYIRRREPEKAVAILEEGLRSYDDPRDDTLITLASFLLGRGGYSDHIVEMLRRLRDTRAAARINAAVQSSQDNLAKLRLRRV